MRRMLLTAVTSSALALAVPSVAAAHDGEHHQSEHQRAEHVHHHHHHRGAHRRHHRHHAHLVKFGTASNAPTPGGSTAASPLGGHAGDAERAGTIASFSDGVLTLTLTDGTTISGKVTDATEIECPSPAPTATAADDRHGDHGDDDRGDDNGFGGEDHHGGPGDCAGRGDDHGGQAEHCTTAALVPGAVVAEAELRVGGGGSVWEKVELAS